MILAVTDPAIYLACNGEVFNIPHIVPSGYPVISAGATAANRKELCATNAAACKAWNTYKMVLITTRDQFSAAIDDIYYAILDDPTEGLNTINLRTLVMHILNTYAQISQPDLDDNMTNFHSGIHSSLRLVPYTKKQEKCQVFATNAGVPISNKTMITTGTKHALECGNMTLAWRKWKRCPPINHTWPNLKGHWTATISPPQPRQTSWVATLTTSDTLPTLHPPPDGAHQRTFHSITTTSLVNSTITCTYIEPGCANPVQLDHTAFINTVVSISLLMKKTPVAFTTQPNVQISIVQPGGDCMMTTHAINLLHSKLPPEACLAHRLPGLVNNLLSVAILCNAGSKVFFHKTGCKVTLNGETILQGWRDPKNCHWRVMIVDDGWTTKLTIRDITRPIILLSTTPTGHLTNSMPILPSKSNTTLANSLYECSNTGQLTNYYYACLNLPIKSTLTKAINRGYLKSWQGLTSQRTCRHICVSTESKMEHMDQQCQGV